MGKLNIEEWSKLKLNEILTDVYQSSIGIEDAEEAIKLKIGKIIDEAAIGIGSCDATEAAGEISREIEAL